MKLFLKKKVKLEIAADCMLEFMRDEKKRKKLERSKQAFIEILRTCEKKGKIIRACMHLKEN